MNKALFKKTTTIDELFLSIERQSHATKLRLAIVLTELKDIYRQKITQAEYTHKNKPEVEELPHLLEN